MVLDVAERARLEGYTEKKGELPALDGFEESEKERGDALEEKSEEKESF